MVCMLSILCLLTLFWVFFFGGVGHKNTDNTRLEYSELLRMHVNPCIIVRSTWYLLVDGLVCRVGL